MKSVNKLHPALKSTPNAAHLAVTDCRASIVANNSCWSAHICISTHASRYLAVLGTDRNSETIERNEIFMDCYVCMFHISSATVRQMTVRCAVSGLSDCYKYLSAPHCRLALNSYWLHSSPIPSSSFQALEWPKFPQTNRHITFSQLLRHRPEPPEEGSSMFSRNIVTHLQYGNRHKPRQQV